MKKIIKIRYMVDKGNAGYDGRTYKINIDPDELMANAEDRSKVLDLIKEAVQAPESTVRGTCRDIIIHRATAENVRCSPKYQRFIIVNPGMDCMMAVIDLGKFDCPYCGFEAHTLEDYSHEWHIFCMTCGATSKNFDDPKEAAKAFLSGELLIKPHITGKQL